MKLFNQLGSTESTILVLNGLLNNQPITALNSGDYKCTRASNIIVTLRANGLIIDSVKVKTESKKWYVSYKLPKGENNIRLAKELLGKLSA